MKHDGNLFTLENDDLLITVERRGAQLSRIYDKKAGREVLWGADPAVWGRHSPILFPFVGKSFENTYRHEGREYGISQHGFARDMDFEPVLCDSDECWYRLKDTPETFEKYPFHFELEIGHRLEGRTVTTMWRVTNPDSGELLFMIGAHPAFAVPEGKTVYDFAFRFEGQEELHYLAPDGEGYREDALSGTLKLENGQVPLSKGFFDRVLTYIFDQGQVKKMTLLLDGQPYVTMECGGFPYLALWTVEATHPFVCLEPWYGICDKKGYQGELKDREGVIALSGWETWQASYSIHIDKCTKQEENHV